MFTHALLSPLQRLDSGFFLEVHLVLGSFKAFSDKNGQAVRAHASSLESLTSALPHAVFELNRVVSR